MADEIQSDQSTVSDETQEVTIKVRVQNPDQSIYSNVVAVTITPWDVRVNFADYAPSGKAGGGVDNVKAIVGVIMSPEQAASLAILLNRQLENFESQFGQVRKAGFGVLRHGRVEKLESE